ncbi:MAG: helix-turn-helix transcriptional regulator [Lachnospiraceae bacterium]|nr:helix-turn-helix transcriptional regulator [Lachnospiraceae bacterium]
MGERIRKLRKTLDLTQQKFGERIGIKGNTVAQYELGRNEPVDAVFSLICREFDVREEWLRTGEGEMFKAKPSDILDQLAYKYKLFNFDYVMIEKFLAMPPDLRRAIYDHFHDVDAALAKMDPYAPAYAGNEPPQPMDRIMETIKSQQKENAAPNISIEQAEAAYIKSRLNSALKTTSFASNTIEENTKKKNA